MTSSPSPAPDPLPDAAPGLELTFVGTATTVLRHGGVTILTDPNFLHAGDHAPLGYGLRSRRLTEPAMEIGQLPPIDFVVLSHHHGDHFDPVAADQLDKDLPIVTEPGSARKLGRQGFRHALALRTWETWERAARTGAGGRVQITAMPARHAPRPLAPFLPSVMGSMIDFWGPDTRSLRLYVSGDTLLHDRLAEIPRRFASIDVCLLHLGGTRIAGVLLTMDADQGVRFLQLIRPRQAVPVHFDDYTVFRSPLDDFRRRAEQAGIESEIRYVTIGDTIHLTGRVEGGRR